MALLLSKILHKVDSEYLNRGYTNGVPDFAQDAQIPKLLILWALRNRGLWAGAIGFAQMGSVGVNHSAQRVLQTIFLYLILQSPAADAEELRRFGPILGGCAERVCNHLFFGTASHRLSL